MIYGEEKVRQMARSILPSKRSSTSRVILQGIEQSHRAYVRQNIRRIDEDWELPDSFDPKCDPQIKVAWEVGERREADKLGHFESWAVSKVKDIPDADARVAHMRAILPDGVIGQHAMGHLRAYEEFHLERTWYDSPRRYVRQTHAEREAEAKVIRAAAHEHRATLLKQIIEQSWSHRLFNKHMEHKTIKWPVWTLQVPTTQYNGDGKYITTRKDQYVDVPQGPLYARKLGGMGDIEDFLNDVYRASSNRYSIPSEPHIIRETRSHRYGLPIGKEEPTYILERISTTRPNPDHHPEWLQSVYQFLTKWEAAKGDRKTLLIEHKMQFLG